MLKVQHKGQTLKLKWLTNEEYERAEKLSGLSLNTCPTCLTRQAEVPERIEDEPKEIQGTYRFRGEEHVCECQAQIALRARYLLAGIGDQYMRLDWADYDGSDAVKKYVNDYLKAAKSMRLNGMGLEFGGKLGVGKTFGATHIGKEMVKRGERVTFVPFVNVVSAFQREDSESYEEQLKTVTYLILDELLPAASDAQHSLYAFRLEALIRHRTNFNLPTIITTNMKQKELNEAYPRTYSLLEAKQIRIDMSGVDARRNHIAEENLELATNGEVRPIT